MELIAGQLNKRMMQDLNLAYTPKCLEVKVAVAYANHDCLELFNKCIEHGKKLTFFGRYDENIPVSAGVVKWFLERKDRDAECRLISDFYHPKIIWWVGCGVYIGSANLSSRAWTQNVEVGTFISDDEMQMSGIDTQLGNIFFEIEDMSHGISPAFLEHLKKLVTLGQNSDKESSKLREKFEQERFFPKGKGLATGQKKSPKECALDKFKERWVDSLDKLWYIEKNITDDKNRPHWIPEATPKGVQTDQFLFAYHHFFVGGFNGDIYVVKAHEKNKNRKNEALQEAVNWWRESDFDYSKLEIMVSITAPRLKELLSRDKILTLSLDQFCEMLSKVH
ncbi:MAG: phospholipase D-like domain-containing protein, partial [Polaromonas sp.]|nr:phospholipase D-like domain-containing protein [Polaromonas sp.]